MGIAVLPVASSASGPSAKSFTVPAVNKVYSIVAPFSAGAYSITTSPTSSQVTLKMYASNINQGYTEYTTTSGTLNAAFPVDYAGAWVDISAGSNVLVTITQTASTLSPAEIDSSFAPTLDTITTTGTYNSTGLLYVMAVGGGGGGGGATTQGSTTPGGGGGSGGVTPKLVFTNTAQSVTLGAAGNAGALTQNGGSGGSTTFGSLVTANGGTGGTRGNDGGQGGAAPSGGGAGGNPGAAGTASTAFTAITTGTTGGGGGGNSGTGAGSGIGTGGNGGFRSSSYATENGNSATGYGAGGGGGGGRANNQNDGRAGGSGSAGVVYVRRGY